VWDWATTSSITAARSSLSWQSASLPPDWQQSRVLAGASQPDGAFRENGKEYLYAGFNLNGILFTLDGKYLITSGLNTKVWRVG
jgi:hypothetical protein